MMELFNEDFIAFKHKGSSLCWRLMTQNTLQNWQLREKIKWQCLQFWLHLKPLHYSSELTHLDNILVKEEFILCFPSLSLSILPSSSHCFWWDIQTYTSFWITSSHRIMSHFVCHHCCIPPISYEFFSTLLCASTACYLLLCNLSNFALTWLSLPYTVLSFWD